MFGLFKRKKVQVYCQYPYCRKDLTDVGGFVGDNGKIYCHHGFEAPNKCPSFGCMEDNTIYHDLEKMIAVDEISKKSFTAGYRTPKEIQQDIREGKIIHFNQLEKVASIN